jgi:hypothetical protein
LCFLRATCHPSLGLNPSSTSSVSVAISIFWTIRRTRSNVLSIVVESSLILRRQHTGYYRDAGLIAQHFKYSRPGFIRPQNSEWLSQNSEWLKQGPHVTWPIHLLRFHSEKWGQHVYVYIKKEKQDMFFYTYTCSVLTFVSVWTSLHTCNYLFWSRHQNSSWLKNHPIARIFSEIKRTNIGTKSVTH